MTASRPHHDADEERSDWSKLPAAPLVSVVMITYNHEPYIRQALDSVLMQKTGFPFEICLGEDGSTDGTREICLEYAARYPGKIRLFLRNRNNRARAQYKVPFMHNGVETYKSCRGKYVAVLEGDDYWTSNRKLERQVAVLEADPGISVCSHYTMAVPQDRPWKVFCFPFRHLDRFDLDYLLSECFFLATCSLVYRRIDIANRGEFRKAYAGDTLKTAMHLEHGTGVVLPDVMAVYRMHAKGASAGGAGYEPTSANIKQWQLFDEMYSPAHRSAIDKGYLRVFYTSIIANRQRYRWREAAALTARLLYRASAMRSVPLRARLNGGGKCFLALLMPSSDKILSSLSNWSLDRNSSS